jgi:hypothetical protein
MAMRRACKEGKDSAKPWLHYAELFQQTDYNLRVDSLTAARLLAWKKP